MAGNLKHYFLLNLTVFIWGFTGVLGDEISLDANSIVFYRMGIAFLSLVLIGIFFKKKRRLTGKEITLVLLTGAIVGFHWFSFFLSIKLSTVQIAVVCMSSATLFTAFIEPLIFKRKILFSEIILSCLIVVGIIFIIGFEPEHLLGIMVGLLSAFLASVFNVLNGRFIKTMPSFQITKYEMLGGFITMSVLMFYITGINQSTFQVTTIDWIYLLVLALVCTTAAFLTSVWLMKFLSPFTVSMSINMEPIYAILIVLVLNFFRGGVTEKMSFGFYMGTLIIIGSIFVNAYLKKKKSKR